MIIKKGQHLLVKHQRTGTWKGIAIHDFDTEKDEWYPIALLNEFVKGLTTVFKRGDNMPARRKLCKVEKIIIEDENICV